MVEQFQSGRQGLDKISFERGIPRGLTVAPGVGGTDQDRGSRQFFMARCSGKGLEIRVWGNRGQKKAPFRVLFVKRFEAGAVTA